ncbi:probable receptor-like serine/threonine-protein kinase At5g57670 isoform X3 [Cynara cardunculus var. scolymus]|uniref:probable receptor-like serine/threonine-protein kinase At5g57670 isoform X3 n=1 Tax=Cynara cardunculus var. scolymus TaxID=59895 RepID=UPI000D62425B|nr:probable receptor-like serine/threonine-protein kinase At5g57670 isoform X3 [Cynara cardunculus var. scolymus]
MTQSELAGEYKDRNVDGGRTVVVGVKLDSPSRELLTWALVKAAHPGDRVIALHVLTNNEIVDPDGKSSLLSLVKAFDSILAVYEGFCNLKQVDLKLKICRGNSARKILVREAKSYGANEVIVGTAITHHAIKSSSSVAKYCARKLSKNCSIIAVNNGKIVFHRDSRSSPSNVGEKENMIGRGGNSEVYKGCLPDGRELAVKILKTSEDVLKEFVLEIEIITALHHENIISLFGFCFEDSKLLLVYDLLSRGSLEDNLHGHKKDTVFGWNERYKVAVGVAKALVYLHNNCDKHVIHRDVKSSNILLSDDFEPQLSDFGLAKWATPTGLHITCTDVAGTFGYLAPEYFMHGKVTEKIDVYAFGVVLLELLTRRKPITSGYPKGEESLVMWAKPILSSGKFARLLDPSLGDDYDFDQMERMALASTLCIRRAPRARPQMTTILKLLGGDVEVTKWARLEVDSTGGSDARLHISNIAEEEEEGFSQSNLRSHLNLALLDIEDSSLSMSSSIEDSISIEDYLRGRWSRSSSFD